MQTIEIPQKNWPSVLDQFSLTHEGQPISVDVLSSEIGSQPEIRRLPLIGVVVEPLGRGDAITISAARERDAQTTHAIHSPTRVWIERAEDGADVALQIESTDGTKTILRLND